MLLKPRFGIRMWSGIWPPSKPFTDTPERLFWPFWPRPPVLPRPEPMPRPTRTRPLRAPGLSRSEENTSELQALMRISYAVFSLKTKKDHRLEEHIYKHKSQIRN